MTLGVYVVSSKAWMLPLLVSIGLWQLVYWIFKIRVQCESYNIFCLLFGLICLGVWKVHIWLGLLDTQISRSLFAWHCISDWHNRRNLEFATRFLLYLKYSLIVKFTVQEVNVSFPRNGFIEVQAEFLCSGYFLFDQLFVHLSVCDKYLWADGLRMFWW